MYYVYSSCIYIGWDNWKCAYFIWWHCIIMIKIILKIIKLILEVTLDWQEKVWKEFIDEREIHILYQALLSDGL